MKKIVFENSTWMIGEKEKVLLFEET